MPIPGVPWARDIDVDLEITSTVVVPAEELEFTAIRARGPGGQNVNKVASAIRLRFDIEGSSLPDDWKRRLLALRDNRIGDDGVIRIRSDEHRTQERNRQAAVERLRQLLLSVSSPPKKRVPTRPTRAARKKRLDNKGHRGKVKSLRGKVRD